MQRQPINPVSWSIPLGFNAAELVEGQRRVLICSGQDAVDATGSPQHPGDMTAQIEAALDNLVAILAAAGMTLANVVRLNAYTTDLDKLFQHWTTLTDRFPGSGGSFATSLLGVTQLPAQLLVMLEATAMD
jgi:enamine deaminase RidA (YjgF/YER057c/UK114 family)